jgi:hypothetical protein
MRSRLLLTAAAVFGYTALNRTHEIVSPLVSGPMAAQQLSDSNAAYVGTQVVSSWFNGSGLSVGVLLIALIAIWYGPVVKLLKSY